MEREGSVATIRWTPSPPPSPLSSPSPPQSPSPPPSFSSYYGDHPVSYQRKERRRTPYPLKSEDLKLITINFDDKNHMGETHFGQVYRGKVPMGFPVIGGRDVTVKMVGKNADVLLYIDLEEDLIKDEVKFLSDTSVNRYPNLVKLIGYCDEKENWGVVYDLSPLDTLYNLILRDEFTWVKRIKVAVGMARLLKFLHGKKDPYVVFNLDPSHILLDQECNPILFDVGLLHGGSIGDLKYPKTYAPLPRGYIDSWYSSGGHKGTWCDVYVYGMILLELIANRTFDKKAAMVANLAMVDKWAQHNYNQKCSLVHDSFKKESGYDANDGVLLTELAMRCIADFPEDRPTMHQVLDRLQVVAAASW